MKIWKNFLPENGVFILFQFAQTSAALESYFYLLKTSSIRFCSIVYSHVEWTKLEKESNLYLRLLHPHVLGEFDRALNLMNICGKC